MALDQAFAKKIQDHLHGGAELTQPSGHKVLLMTADGNAIDNGTELASGGDYVAGTGQSVSFSAATLDTPSASNNSAAVAFTGMPAAAITGIEIWAGSDRLEYGSLASPKTTSAGDTLSFAIGAISSTLK